MSSHHIVRDEQEPALLILSDRFESEFINNLLEWSPTVIIDARLAEFISKLSFNVDVVIGAINELEEARSLLSHQEPVKYLSKNNGDDTLLQALYFLSAANYKAVNVIGDFNSRVIEQIEEFSANITTVIFDRDYKWYRINDPIYRKWLPKGHELKFHKPSNPISVKNVVKKDFSWIVENDGMTEIEIPDNYFWLGESI